MPPLPFNIFSYDFIHPVLFKSRVKIGLGVMSKSYGLFCVDEVCEGFDIELYLQLENKREEPGILQCGVCVLLDLPKLINPSNTDYK